ncbi:MAG: hypothetical protein IPP97_01735 [Candidatus Obscuribacter sp.]|jgi:hypothetical protein|nr:hypothetical protein [Candidatus Obscuribacter sp.]MBL0184435.1 hypothetical protein [Candidatus Obscuribacter sp.]MBP6350207.1 hypothetical protein [Candidatus Obscuribacter sp.]MBP6592254.1 hypothetical protein [Candidatus Obscuribacter sp.]MBP7575612.1 hypothetical protein [Candidatus Obscuribacter sp.]
MSEANPHPPQSEKGATLDDLADEIKGKEPVNADLFAGLMNMVQATNSGESVTMPAAPAQVPAQVPATLATPASAKISKFGSKLADDQYEEVGGGIGKTYHASGDLTYYNQDCSYTQTVKQGGYFRVKTEAGEVVFHLRPDGDMDFLAPHFDDTLRRVNAGAGILYWTNADGSIKITLDTERGVSSSFIDHARLPQEPQGNE